MKPTVLSFKKIALESITIPACFVIGPILTVSYNELLAFCFVFWGVLVYFYFLFSRKDLLDFRGVFTGVWFSCIGIAQFRFSEIQVPWSLLTWLLHFLAIFAFILGFNLVERYSLLDNNRQKKPRIAFKLFGEEKPKRVFYAACAITVGAIAFFIAQISMKGFLPIFDRRYDSYIRFYNRLAIFVNTIAIVPPLAYWSIKNVELRKWQKALAWAMIPLPTVIFQLAVQRGLFLSSLFIFSFALIKFSKKKLFALLLLLVMSVSGMMFATVLRSIPPEAMSEIWKISPNTDQTNDSQIDVSNNVMSFETEITQVTDKPLESTKQVASNENFIEGEGMEVNSLVSGEALKKSTITLPSFLYAPYYYIINGLENFNYLVNSLEKHSFGIRQIAFLGVVLRFNAFRTMVSQYPHYSLLPRGTDCLIYDFYYDFGVAGVFLEMLVFGALCSYAVCVFNKRKSASITVVCGILLYVLVESFFAAWLSNFAPWFFLGTTMLASIYTHAKSHRRNILNHDVID